VNERLIYTWLGYGPDMNGIYPNRPILDMNAWHGEVIPKLKKEDATVNFTSLNKSGWEIDGDNYGCSHDPYEALTEYLTNTPTKD